MTKRTLAEAQRPNGTILERLIFAILPRFLEDLLQNEDLVQGAATQTKTALAIFQF